MPITQPTYVIRADNFLEHAGAYTDQQVANPRRSSDFSTASLAAGAGESGTVSLAKGWRAIRISTNRPARVRLYSTVAKRDADVTRAVGTSPTGDHGCLLDTLTDTGLLGFDLVPQAVGNNMEATPSAAIPYRVDNRDTVAGVVTITIVWQQEEA